MNTKINGDLAELFGIHLGDGCISKNDRYSEYYLGGDITEEKEYHNDWVRLLFNKNIMFPLYGKEVLYKEHPKVGVYGFHIFDGKIVNFFSKFNINHGTKLNAEVPKKVLSKRRLYGRFIRGIFDTDGTLYFDKNRSSKNPINNQPRIKLGLTSQKLISQLKIMLEDLGFSPRWKKPYKGKRDKHLVYAIIITKRKDIENFIYNICFKNSKHFTKWQVFKKLGYCPPKTTLAERKEILSK